MKEYKTPEDVIAEIERISGIPMSEPSRSKVYALFGEWPAESIIAAGIHDCDKCPVYDDCDQEEKKPRGLPDISTTEKLIEAIEDLMP
jgi:hypothetical protein